MRALRIRSYRCSIGLAAPEPISLLGGLVLVVLGIAAALLGQELKPAAVQRADQNV